MRRWKEYEANFPAAFEELIGEFVQEALIRDEKDATINPLAQQLDRLMRMQPYPSRQIDALNTEMRRKSAEFDSRINAVAAVQERTRNRIRDHAATKLFSSIKERLVTSQIELWFCSEAPQEIQPDQPAAFVG